METETKKVEKKNEIDLFINKEIKKFDYSKVYFDKIKKKFSKLTITDIDDKEGYEAVRKALAETRTTKAAIEKKRKEIKENSIKFGRAVDAEAARLVELVLPIHQELQAKKDVIDKEKAELKEKKKAEKAKVVTQRSIKLMETGLEFDGLKYHYDDLEISVAELAVYNDENFNAFIEEVQEVIKKDQEEKKAMQDLAELISSRVTQLKEQGLQECILPEEAVSYNYGSMTEEKFKELVEELKSRKKAAESKIKINDARYKKLAPVLQYSDSAIDITSLYKMEEVEFSDIYNDLCVKKKRIEDERKAADKLRKENEEKAKELAERAAKIKEQEDKAAAVEAKRLADIQAKKDEAARKKAAAELKPDLEKIKEYIDSLTSTEVPVCKTEKGKETVKNLVADLKNITTDYLNKIK